MKNKTYSLTYNDLSIEDKKGNNTRWIQDESTISKTGHLEYPLDPSVEINSYIFIENVKYVICSIIGDGTARSSITLDKVAYTGRINKIIAASNSTVLKLAESNNSDDFFGTSTNDLNVTAAGTVINTYTYGTTHANVGVTQITVASISGFSIGDEILIHQVQDGSGNGKYGFYEFNYITGLSGNTITLRYPMRRQFLAGNPNASGAYNFQVIRVPHYRNVTISSSGYITAKTWDGYSGGLVIFRVNGTFTNNGSINVSGIGFRGAGSNTTGEGYGGLYTGGDGAGCSNCGSPWRDGWGNGGGGGWNLSSADASRIMLGNAGGGGGGHPNPRNNPGGGSGCGAGAIMVFANKIINSGSIIANGAGGGAGTFRSIWSVGWYSGGGGGGGGGTIYIHSNSLTNSGSISTPGAGGGDGGRGGGTGDSGLVYLYYKAYTGNAPTSAYYYNNSGNALYYPTNIITYAITNKLKLTDNDVLYDITVTDFEHDRYYNRIRYLISFDDGKTWYRHNGSSWVLTPFENCDTDGMTSAYVNSISGIIINTTPFFNVNLNSLRFLITLKTTNPNVTPTFSNIVFNTRQVDYIVDIKYKYRSINGIVNSQINNFVL